MQSSFWGSFKSAFGWKAVFIEADNEIDVCCPLLVLQKKIIRGVTLAYIPWGPLLPEMPREERFCALERIAAALKKRLPRSTAFIRFDPPWEEGGVFKGSPLGEGGSESRESGCSEGGDFPPHIKNFIKAPADIQPPCTVVINLTPAEDEILAQMKSKTRYNIRLGLKNVTVKRPDAAGLPVFYALFRQTCARDGIALHSEAYYKKLFELGGDKLGLYIAEHENEPLAAIIVIFFNGTATYLYGASSNQKRNLMAAYALQWQAIRDAKALGCSEYDMFGIPPGDDPTHPMHGLWRFKTGFGGRFVIRSGSWDYPLRPFVYSLFRLAEAARKALRDLKKHKHFSRD
ncbi:MAG: peptidoglycan bridge formation glycyltransferase FemA/FemB family protein [Spirochaetaceae bacterium]|nr:peptidoglycan bridge formation glycyltransferase FemA/FemB family protein [Spirochaetaceae bacterium]